MRNNCLRPLAALAALLFAELVFSAPAQNVEPAKTYAVFTVSYSTRTGQAIGGVAGTAFFTSKQNALTAFHVLQPNSFLKAEGLEHRRIWLVHENETPIEVLPEYLHASPDRDTTEIRFPKSVAVNAQNIFEMAASRATSSSDSFETEGFVAGSVGPELAWVNGDLAITSVPRLSRLHFAGALLRSSNIDLHATDVNLKEAPCLQISYKPVVGISGGPVLVHGRVVAMNSFADPTTRNSTWALRLN